MLNEMGRKESLTWHVPLSALRSLDALYAGTGFVACMAEAAPSLTRIVHTNSGLVPQLSWAAASRLTSLVHCRPGERPQSGVDPAFVARLINIEEVTITPGYDSDTFLSTDDYDCLPESLRRLTVGFLILVPRGADYRPTMLAATVALLGYLKRLPETPHLQALEIYGATSADELKLAQIAAACAVRQIRLQFRHDPPLAVDDAA